MSDNIAVLDGYTREIHLVADTGLELFLLIRPDTELNERFRAWDMDGQEFIRVNGWLFSIA